MNTILDVIMQFEQFVHGFEEEIKPFQMIQKTWKLEQLMEN